MAQSTRPKSSKLRFLAAIPLVLAAVAAFGLLHVYERPVLDTAALLRLSARKPSSQPDRSVDLHAHLFMRPGMKLLFKGDFFGPLKARDWKSRFNSQANAETVESSGIGILVVALYANPIFTWSPRAAIREEIRQAELFVSQHPDEWIIARDPAQARQAIAQGKRVLVLSLERASWIIETDEDIKEFIDEKGIRIVTLLHLTDDRFGGVAFLKGYHQLSTPWRWIESVFHPVHDATGAKINPHGLTEKGREMARKLIARGVWLDLSHSSDASQRDLIPLLEQAGQPLLYTHGGLRRFTQTERGVSDEQLAEVGRSQGIVGICPTEDEMNPTSVPAAFCGGSGCPQSCDWGLPGFVVQFSAAAAVIGASNVFVGTDFNGALPHLHPSCGTGTELDRVGLWNIGQMPIFWEAARRLGAPVPARLSDQMDSFLDKWARVTRP